MAGIRIEPVESRRQQKQFVELAWQINADNPHWVPPLRRTQQELLGYKRHPFHDDADVQTFLATKDGRPCGRIAAIIHRAHQRRYKERRGYFGFFESIDDEEVSGALFDVAIDWLRQNGMESVRGPMNPSFNYELGMLIDGFDKSPTFMMTYNPPYYHRLVERYGGFAKAQDMYAYRGDLETLKTLRSETHALFIVDEAKRRLNLQTRQMNKAKFGEEIRMFLNIYNRAFDGHWGFVPLSEGEVVRISSELKHLIAPELTTVAEVDGEPVGCVFGMPDYNPRIKKIDGRLFPTGLIRLLWNRRAISRVRMIATNVVPEYQRWGVGLVLLHEMVPAAIEWGLQEAEFSWIMESNRLSVGTCERGGCVRTKTYRLYDRDLGDGSS